MRKTIYSPGHAIFIRLLREQRLAAGLNQGELAARLGTAQSVISKLETGDRQMDVLELRQFCLAVGTTLEDFVQRLEGEMSSTEAD